MTINRIFIVFMTLCGLIIAGLVMFFPQSRNFGIPPYFWVLIAMVVFEGIAFALSRGAPGTVITMESRVIGFVVAIALMLLVPYAAGLPLVRLF